MTLQLFRDFLTKRPFIPFKVVTSSGQTYEVRHPETAFLTRTAIFIGVNVGDDGFPDDARIVSLLHIAAIEPITPQAA